MVKRPLNAMIANAADTQESMVRLSLGSFLLNYLYLCVAMLALSSGHYLTCFCCPASFVVLATFDDSDGTR